MKRSLLILAALGMLVASPAWSHTNTFFGFTIGVSNAPPPPPIVFRERPHLEFVPEERVYVVDDDDDDCDMFMAGDFWYVYNDGYWYRAHSYRGPFRVVDVRYVPRRVLFVPEGHWRHHPHGGPPGQMKKFYGVEYSDRDHDHGEHHGHGHHHGHHDDD